MTRYDLPVLYRETRLRVTDLVRPLDDEALLHPVPACPRWTVMDLVSHLTGVATDVRDGNADGPSTDTWTARQVEQRRSQPLFAVLDEWAAASGSAEQALGQDRPMIAVLHDAITHEADARGALGAGRPPEQAWQASLTLLLKGLKRIAKGPGTLVVHGPDVEGQAGAGEPPSEVSVADGYELWRGLMSRRSRNQLAEWDWSGPEADAWIEGFGVFGPRETDLVEH